MRGCPVVLRELHAQPARIITDDRVERRLEIIRSIEHRYSDAVFTEIRGAASQSFFDDKFEESPHSVAPHESLACENARDLRPYRLSSDFTVHMNNPLHMPPLRTS